MAPQKDTYKAHGSTHKWHTQCRAGGLHASPAFLADTHPRVADTAPASCHTHLAVALAEVHVAH